MSVTTTCTAAPAQKPHHFHPQPEYHLKAPHGWMNDPCAPTFDPTTGTYHIFYQWNPRSCEWGNICWGHATSPDGLRWNHNTIDPVLQPSEPYDNDGIWTGCLWPTGPKGEKDQLTVIYSSITSLSIHWTREHIRGSEGVSLATSTDNGKTWRKSDLNPIIKNEPEDLRVTGFRDPFLGTWPALDEIRGEKSLYGILSGGIADKTPTVFIYAVSPTDLTEWKYLGPLVDLVPRFRIPGPWTGDFGINWECVNYMTLRSDTEERDFLLMGTEGGFKSDCKERDPDNLFAWCLWFAGSLEQTAEGPKLRHDLDGILDHGTLYAPNSYEHPVTKKRIAFGWIKEEELTLARREAKGWTGYLSLPRELFLYSARNVVRGLKSPLDEIRSIRVISDSEGVNTIHTLGIRPLDDMRLLRPSRPDEWSTIGGSDISGILKHRTRSTSWELEAVINAHARRVGFHICHNADTSLRTSIFFDTVEEKIVVDRSASNHEPDIRKNTLSGAFTLFYSREQGRETLEALRLRIFRDGDTLEVFANDRFALSTTVCVDETCGGISWFVEGGGDAEGAFEMIRLWDGLGREDGRDLEQC
ncbi:hypothetical protein CEP51_005311 [Fusarium floridanum]|uniref:Glycosyl hydrolase family 32 N-terminal domain-containing protein n=1 Tax=Fusarium floridanum TaxID=1325733 RepID=A0A428RXM4_9HYPO|nr:hypothetical protein CEP51_005311 [Fusarium floridanum]